MSETDDHKERRRAVSRSTARLTPHQAEMVKHSIPADHAKQGGIIRDSAMEAPLSSRLNEIEDKAMAVEPTKVVISIVIFAVIFIAVITWLIAVMPPKQ